VLRGSGERMRAPIDGLKMEQGSAHYGWNQGATRMTADLDFGDRYSYLCLIHTEYSRRQHDQGPRGDQHPRTPESRCCGDCAEWLWSRQAAPASDGTHRARSHRRAGSMRVRKGRSTTSAAKSLLSPAHRALASSRVSSSGRETSPRPLSWSIV
jgi:hypothetical protein